MMDVIVKLERKGCVGCGACASIYPNLFEMLDDGKSMIKGVVLDDKTHVFEKQVSQDDLECAQNARMVCPVGVIHVIKEGE